MHIYKSPYNSHTLNTFLSDFSTVIVKVFLHIQQQKENNFLSSNKPSYFPKWAGARR
jgi:hypothetical protein